MHEWVIHAVSKRYVGYGTLVGPVGSWRSWTGPFRSKSSKIYYFFLVLLDLNWIQEAAAMKGQA